MSLTEEQLKNLALQLGNPHGEHGINVAKMMHDSNIGMTMSTINALKITNHNLVLELGHGSGKHISEVLKLANDVRYTGLEISELMKTEAESQNLSNVSFNLYNGNEIPFNDNSFNKIMTVNTIYFWKNPVELLNEIYRVLKPNGIFCIGFAQKEFMQMLPFTQHGFNLYDNAKLVQLNEETAFKLMSLAEHTEKIRSKADEMVDRAYTVATLQK